MRCKIFAAKNNAHVNVLSHSSIAWNSFDFREIPLLVAQRTHTAGLQPTLDAIQMEHMTAVSKSYAQSIFIVRRRTCLFVEENVESLWWNLVTKKNMPKAVGIFCHNFHANLTWYSIDGSFREFLQIAQVSAQISQDHMVTAFHFLISNRTALPPLSSFAVASSTFSSTSIFFSSAMIKSSYLFCKKTTRIHQKGERFDISCRFSSTEACALSGRRRVTRKG